MRSKTITGKVVLVTGASSGLGKAIAGHLASLGHKVYGTSRKPSATAHGFAILQADVRSDESVRRLVDQVIALEGRVDALVNNAGMGIAGSAEDCSMGDIQLQVDTNLLGTIRLCKAVLPHMRRQGSGTIINVSSMASIVSLPFQSYYSATKCAIDGFSSALRSEVKPWGINVVVIHPGDFQTGFTDSRVLTAAAKLQDSVYFDQFHETLAVYESDERDGARPETMARLIARVLSKRSPRHSYLVGKTGQKLSMFIKKILPSKIFTPLMESSYKISSRPKAR